MAVASCRRRKVADRGVVRGPAGPLTETARQRAVELLRTEIDFIPNREFRFRVAAEEDSRGDSLSDVPRERFPAADRSSPLRPTVESALLTHEQEIDLFREMNYAKFRAHTLRARLDPEDVDAVCVATIDRWLARSRMFRDQIIQSNVRLVVSIAKKMVTPRRSFDEVFSDGMVALMQTVEKFDFDRGFRFSTYAYRSIARAIYRSVVAGNTQFQPFHEVEELVSDTTVSPASAVRDQVWSKLRDIVMSSLVHLDRREQFVIRSRYALGAHRRVRSCQFLAGKLGVSKERVRQLESRAVSKLQKMLAAVELDEMMGVATP